MPQVYFHFSLKLTPYYYTPLHVVVLPKDRITKNYEDVWDMIRNNNAMGDPSQKKDMPRTVNFITGHSRSGDIEQTLLLGAHGPRRLHIILVESD